MKTLLQYFFSFVVFVIWEPSDAGERVALVIGNGAYENATRLDNPVNDARLLASSLELADFTVSIVEDASLIEMEKALIEFRRAADGADAAWFFYAGHGLEVKGRNYLIPVDARIEEEFQVKHKAFALDMVMGALDEAGTPLKVVVLDCCRNNPFGRSWSRSASSGLAQVTNTPRGTIVAYAAAPGSTAEDGVGDNSPYSEALATALQLPGREIDQVFKETGRLVLKTTDRKQQPWVNSSFYDTFIVIPDGGQTTAPSPGSPPMTAPPVILPAAPRVLKPYVLPGPPNQILKADESIVEPQRWPVGKWPEAIARVGDSIWVAESGQRTLGQYNIWDGGQLQEVSCGRFPLHMTTVGDVLYTTIATSRYLYRQPPGGNGGSVLEFGSDYPEEITSLNNSIYILFYPDGSSANSIVKLFDSSSEQTTTSDLLGPNAKDLVPAGGNLWVAVNQNNNGEMKGMIHRLDAETLARRDSIEMWNWTSQLAAGNGRLFAAGGWDGYGFVSSYDAASGEEELWGDYAGAPVLALECFGEFVVAVDETGLVHVVRQDSMILQRTIRLPVGEFRATGMIAEENALYICLHEGDNGIVYRVPDWQPSGFVGKDMITRILESESLGGIKLGMTESEMKSLLGEPEVMGQEFANEVQGGYSTELSYPSKGLQLFLWSDERGIDRSIDMINIDRTSSLLTAGGIGIGHSLDEVRLVYGAYEDEAEFPVPADTSEPFTFVAGSIYGGLIMQMVDEKVDSITLGAGAE